MREGVCATCRGHDALALREELHVRRVRLVAHSGCLIGGSLVFLALGHPWAAILYSACYVGVGYARWTDA